jgi:hypothetical protein
VATEAARTAPPRENGGNQDSKNLTKGTRVFYPVFVDGANLSVGDLHFSQGDGEITFCGAIEMGGFINLGVDLIKGGMATYGVSENAIFMPGNVYPQYSQWLAFSGTSVTLDGVQHYLDSHLSYQRACLHAIDYLTKFGYSDIQAYMILGSAPIEGRLSGVVDSRTRARRSTSQPRSSILTCAPRPPGRRRSLAAWMCRRPVSERAGHDLPVERQRLWRVLVGKHVPLESVVGGVAHILSPGDSVPQGQTPTGPGFALLLPEQSMRA